VRLKTAGTMPAPSARDAWVRTVADELMRLGCAPEVAPVEADDLWTILSDNDRAPHAALARDPVALAQASAGDLKLAGASQDSE
jgi:hypothetical protein